MSTSLLTEILAIQVVGYINKCVVVGLSTFSPASDPQGSVKLSSSPAPYSILALLLIPSHVSGTDGENRKCLRLLYMRQARRNGS